MMKLNLAQKIGVGGIVFVLLLSLIMQFGDLFSPYIFTGVIPFITLILIGQSVKK